MFCNQVQIQFTDKWRQQTVPANTGRENGKIWNEAEKMHQEIQEHNKTDELYVYCHEGRQTGHEPTNPGAQQTAT